MAARLTSPADEPSISHTSAGSVSHSTGQAKNGAMASTDSGARRERRRAPAPPAQASHALCKRLDRHFGGHGLLDG